MDFDFHNSYAQLGNVELLKILLQKELYEPAAVEAAKNILASRTVTEEEQCAAENDLAEKNLAVQKKLEQKEKLQEDADRAIKSLMFPEKRTPTYFIRFFTIAYAIFWLFNPVESWYEYIGYWKYAPTLALIYTVFDLATVLMLFWLFTLKKKGWVILMLNFAIETFFVSYSLITWTEPRYTLFSQSDISTHIISLGLCGLVFYYFNRKDVLETLHISRRFQQNTIIFSVALVLAYFLLGSQGVSWNYYFSYLFVTTW